ncbi:MAG TPA: ComEC/Rec2 family competence protein [Paludibacter sp.]|nr:ComEC/Rec2 family competence protein [Paludibacter sp.]
MSLVSIILIIISFIQRKVDVQYKFRWLTGSTIFIFLFALASFLSQNNERNASFTHLNQKGIYHVELIDAPVEKSKSYFCKIKMLSIYENGKLTDSQGNAIVYVQKDSLSAKLIIGDRLMIEAEFKKPLGAVNPDGFDYAAYLKRQGIAATCYLSSGSWLKTDQNTAFSFRRISDQSRKNLLQIYRSFHFEGDEFAVLAALTLGFTDALQPDLRDSYSATGAMHILSVSGLHVGIVYVVIAFLLGFLQKTRGRRLLRIVLILLFLWTYAFLTGLSPSVIRSTLMFTFVAIGTSLDRKSHIYNTIFMSAFFMLLYNPNYLFDVGFQLSYAAVLSIVFFQRPLSGLITVQNKPLRWLRDLIAVSVAAQLGTMAFTLYYFHQFPNYFLLTNVIAIPLSTIVIYLAMVLLAVNFIPYLSVAVAFLLKWSIWLLNFLIVWIENLPYAISVMSFDFRQMIFVLLALFCISYYFYSKKFTPLIFGLLALLLVTALALQMKYETLNSRKMIIYSGQKHTHINFIDRNKNYVFTTDSTELLKIAKSYWRIHSLQKPEYLVENNWFADGFVFFGGKRMLIANEKYWKSKNLSTPLKLDYLIIGNNIKPGIDQLLENVNPAKIIVDNSISAWYTETIRQACIENNIRFYSVAEHGAFIHNFPY